jgi:hypothetical protein
MKKITTTIILLTFVFTGFAGSVSGQETVSNRVALVGFGSFAIAKRTTGAGQVTEIIKRKIAKIYGVVPAIVNRLADIPSVEIPTVEIPQVEIPTVEIPQVEIPTIEIPSVEIPTI